MKSLVKFNLVFILLFYVMSQNSLKAIINVTSAPTIGAQVIIEQGQTQAEIEQLFKILSESNMGMCRIRLFESYMKDKAGNWDFTLFDYAFKAAEKYNVDIYATLFPYTDFEDVGGFKFPSTIEHQKSIAEYIKQVVTHFSKFKSLNGWVLVNEPGSYRAPFNQSFTAHKFAEWKSSQITISNPTDPRPAMNFSEEKFLLEYNSWYIHWLSEEVTKIDPNHHLHVNNHAIFSNYCEYDFPAWRKSISSLGGSAHASWHFGMFSRDSYHYAMSANSEIIRSGAGNLPWIMTEVQGGNNLWSGNVPMCPTKEEIEQWMWTILSTGGKGMIFWSLNHRASGFEAGEWGMLDQLNQPTDRLKKAAEIAKIVKTHSNLFKDAKVEESGIALLYSRESLWIERKSEIKGSQCETRNPGGAMKSIIGFFETLSQMGIQSNIQSLDEYDFRENNKGRVIILAHQISLPLKYKASLEKFVSTGGSLIVEGLTAYFDEEMRSQTNTNANFSSLFGGKIEDIKHISLDLTSKINGELLPTVFCNTIIMPNPQSEVLAKNQEGKAIMTRTKIGNGNVIWLPTCVGIAAHIGQDFQPLSKFIESYIIPSLPKNTVRIKNFTKGVLMKTLRTKEGYIVVLINKNEKATAVEVLLSGGKSIELLNKENNSFLKGTNNFVLQPEETLVVEYHNN